MHPIVNLYKVTIGRVAEAAGVGRGGGHFGGGDYCYTVTMQDSGVSAKQVEYKLAPFQPQAFYGVFELLNMAILSLFIVKRGK